MNKYQTAGSLLLLISLILLLGAGCTRESQIQAGAASSTETAFQQEQKDAEELAQAPDELLSSFSISGYTTDGEKQWDMEGKSADIMTKVIELTEVTGKVYGQEANMTVVADNGSLDRINNNMHLEKNVKATTDDGATLTTDYLDWDALNEELSSEAPVWIKRGMMEADGIGIVGQPTLSLVELKKDVTVKISMPQKQQSLPKQEIDDLVDQVSPPTVITCDGPLEVEYENNLAIFYDNVKVKDSRGEIFADQMDVYFTSQTEGDKQLAGMEGMGIDRIEASGDVEIHQGGNITYSQKAVYDADTGRLTLTGQPRLVIYSTEGFTQAMQTSKVEEAQASEEQDDDR